jgi:rubrerythrin
MARRNFLIIAGIALLAGAAAPAATTAPEPSLGQVLDEALDDERKARATYEAVLAKFGDVRPFSNIVLSEERHEQHLLPLYERYDLEVPEDRWKPESIELPGSVAESCKLAVEAEKSNVAMYDVLLASVDQEDVRGTLVMLRARSLERHLPAFERCASGGGSQGRGKGHGKGGGGGQGFCGGSGGKGHGKGGGGFGGGQGYCGGKGCGSCAKSD